MKKFCCVVVLIVFGSFHFSCKEHTSDGCDDDDYPKTFTMKSMQIQSILIDGYGPVDTNLFYPANDIAKRLSAKDADFFTASRTGFSFINEALACSPVEPQATHYIQKVEVVNQTDSLVIDGRPLPLGADISAYFSMKTTNQENFKPIADFIPLQYKIRYGDSYFLQFAGTPGTQILLRFDLTITMNDGARFRFKDERFNIQ